MDDLSGILLVKGVTQAMYIGMGQDTNSMGPAFQRRLKRLRQCAGRSAQLLPFGLRDVFTPFSSGKININTWRMRRCCN